MSDWTAFLRPATFAGLGFYVKTSKTKAGQRLIVQEVPYANATLENSGLLPKAFTVTAYFLGPGWLAQWTAFLALLDASTTAQTLVLPTLGPLTVQVGEYSYPFDETIGAYGEIEIEFVVDNSAQAPFANADTASKLLNAIGNLTAQIGAAYQAVMGPIAQAAAIAEYEAALLGSAASRRACTALGAAGGGDDAVYFRADLSGDDGCSGDRGVPVDQRQCGRTAEPGAVDGGFGDRDCAGQCGAGRP